MMKNHLSDKTFENLFRKHFRSLVVFAVQYVHSKEIAQDIVQEVFLSIYEKKDSIVLHSSDKNYLYTAVRNKCVDKIRSDKIRTAYAEEYKKTNHPAQPDPLKRIEIIEFEDSYVQALESLSPKCKKVFKLSRIAGKSNIEIAEELNLSKRTVEKHISLALKVIRKKLKKHINL